MTDSIHLVFGCYGIIADVTSGLVLIRRIVLVLIITICLVEVLKMEKV
ncbi:MULTISPECIES: hypothetical protein [unclassified Lactobacillus]|nr:MULTISPECIES: hypothetical protein [unclassified Lactobacillus]MCX8720770.1 hypothetical protein [Lactobacillus sp. B4010]MCX8731774.1 hypothetical protein [Lactobacillus sp. B4015]MCX8733952.1 hypothetical protein [Lactobacillus sp. B4012]